MRKATSRWRAATKRMKSIGEHKVEMETDLDSQGILSGKSRWLETPDERLIDILGSCRRVIAREGERGQSS